MIEDAYWYAKYTNALKISDFTTTEYVKSQNLSWNDDNLCQLSLFPHSK